MPKSVRITTPPRSHEEMVRMLGVPKARQRELLAILKDALNAGPSVDEKPTKSIGPRKSRRRAAAAA
jgi:hypothetical protein